MAKKSKRPHRTTPQETFKTLLDNPETPLLLDKLATEMVEQQRVVRQKKSEERDRRRRREREEREQGSKRIGAAA